ncbi:hypothetical protein PoB_004253200 [Plakobranchus ocellatus]|uniref:Uncharacterized protein n=1 Tax=Plakobranchus ocellatus TaxID=259542 RepID=A0AAV4B9B5_9GAST|nr:hypothetical protein PoB_004253200 [Plakobranchus ocellatus]
MDDLAIASSFEVNCSTSATESSKDNLHRSSKRLQSALRNLGVFTVQLKFCKGYRYWKMVVTAQITVGSQETFGGNGSEATANQSRRSSDMPNEQKFFFLQNLEQ